MNVAGLVKGGNRFSTCGGEGLIEVGEDIVDVLDADAEPDHAGGDAGATLFLCRHLAMSGGSRMAGQRFGVAKIDETRDEIESVVESDSRFHASLNFKGNEGAGLAAEIFLRERIPGAISEAGEIDPFDRGMVAEELCDAFCVLRVTFHAKRDGFDALEEQKRTHR